MHLGKTIHTLRKRNGISQAGMAAKVGISQPALSQIEKGRISGSTETIDKIAKVFGIPTAVLFFISMGPEDIPEDKASDFVIFFPVIKSCLRQLFSENCEILIDKL